MQVKPTESTAGALAAQVLFTDFLNRNRRLQRMVGNLRRHQGQRRQRMVVHVTLQLAVPAAAVLVDKSICCSAAAEHGRGAKGVAWGESVGGEHAALHQQEHEHRGEGASEGVPSEGDAGKVGGLEVLADEGKQVVVQLQSRLR